MINHASNVASDNHRPHGNAASRRIARQPADPGNTARPALLLALDMVDEGVFILDAELRILEVNDAGCRLCGQAADRLRGQRFDVLFDLPPENNVTTAPDSPHSDQATGGARTARRRTEGQPLPAHIRFQFVRQADETMVVAVVERGNATSDTTKAESGENRDYLTGLPSRAALASHLRQTKQWAERHRDRFAVLFIDLDQFKLVNDTAGHRAGDRVLRTLGQRLLASLRPGDFVARYGGDEFVAVIEGVATEDEVSRVVARLQSAVNRPVEIGGRRLKITASFGAALADGGSSAEALLEQADRAMYRDKRRQAISAAQPQR